MVGTRWADRSADVGRGCGEGATNRLEQRPHHGVSGHAQADGRQASCHQRRDWRLRFQRYNEGQRARPMALGELERLFVELAKLVCMVKIKNVHNQWIEAGSSLGFIDTRDRFRVGCVGGEPVDRLGRDRDRLPVEDQPRRFGDCRCIGLEDWNVERARHCAVRYYIRSSIVSAARARSAPPGRSPAGPCGREFPAIRARGTGCARSRSAASWPRARRTCRLRA